MICKKIIASGKVQGVYYRASLRNRAVELGLRGYVQNLSDGSVEAVVTGDPAAIAALEQWCWDGPPMAAVSVVRSTEIIAKEDFNSFEVRR